MCFNVIGGIKLRIFFKVWESERWKRGEGEVWWVWE
jgi:hypothetical protein